MHSVGLERERGLDVVVDDEWNADLAAGGENGAAPLDHFERRAILESKLDHRRAAFRSDARRLGVLHDRVELHASSRFARASSRSGVKP